MLERKIQYYFILLLACLYCQIGLGQSNIKHGILPFDNDSIYTIIDGAPQSEKYIDLLYSSADFDFNTKTFHGIDNNQVTRIKIIYKNNAFPFYFIKGIPFNQEDFPNLKELSFYLGFPKHSLLLNFNSIESIGFRGKNDGHMGEDYFRLPEELIQMNNLKRLDVYGAAFEFPNYIKNFRKLEILFIRGNTLRFSELNVLAIPNLKFLFFGSEVFSGYWDFFYKYNFKGYTNYQLVGKQDYFFSNVLQYRRIENI